MNLIKTLLATTLTLAAATTFAATADEVQTEAQTEDRVVVSTQEQPATDAPSEAAPASEPVAN
ncbi:hypothetical protein [Acinetobacter sp. NIPH 2699]|uniref:hypothetical protein n=1 Tax=Acinetobacter sp. NIPH 2699 TaxID=2923433 RepID=UPI001F4B5C0B|nr:hypothetical protein [Acinetobacter sp. NIPH 2699]MCH7336399.1 hypothetical protein [Acinetobacter sp. NIPH 2699]